MDPEGRPPTRPVHQLELEPGSSLYRLPHQRPRYLLATVLFLATLFTTTTLGAVWYLSTRTDVTTDLFLFVGPRTVGTVWSDPALLLSGLSFSVPVLAILLCHELGHYLTCRAYRLPATLPYFLPVPFALGTLGAFIRIRAPIRNKRELFDVGVSGPIAGFAALLPFLLWGTALSSVEPIRAASEAEAQALLLLPGKCLALEAARWWFHGALPEGTALVLHPFALAAWIGLLATALNLLPLGQLDGGHILYAATGRLQRLLSLPLWLALAAVGLMFWGGWLLWCGIVLVMGLRHPPVIDERAPLDARRRWLAVLAGVLLLLSFMPIPLVVQPVW